MKKLLKWTALPALLVLLASSCSHPEMHPGRDLANRTPQDYDPSTDWYGRFGQCLLSPDDPTYEKLWENYGTLLEKKVRINMSLLSTMPVPPEIHDYISNLSVIAPIVTSLYSIKSSAWMKKQFSDPAFIQLTSSSAFIFALEDPNFIAENHDPDFQSGYAQNPAFKNAIDTILSSVRDPNVQAAITYFSNLKLSFIDLQGMTSANALITFFGLPENLETLTYVPLVKDLQKPTKDAGATDTFEHEFENLLSSTVEEFLKTNPVPVGAGVTQAVANQLNNLQAPDDGSPYDKYVLNAHKKDTGDDVTETILGKQYQLSSTEVAAIDGVARTLWGEVRGCEYPLGLHQFEAVGLVIANRALAVQGAMTENSAIRAQNKQIDIKNVQQFLDNSNATYIKQIGTERSQGVASFGIAGSSELPVVQVVSRPMQFSVWNSFNTISIRLSELGKVPSGIPNIAIKFKRGRDQNNDLVNALCPQIAQNSDPSSGPGWHQTFPDTANENWQEAVDVASLIVLDPMRYKEIYEYAPRPPLTVLYYAHGENVPGTIREPLSSLTYKDPTSGKSAALKLFAAGSGTCQELRIFSSAARTDFGVTP